MTLRHRGGAVIAAALSLSLLAGCSGVPTEVTDVLDTVSTAVGGAVGSLGSALDGMLGGTSVEEARAARREELVPAVDDSALVTPGTLTVGIKTAETAPLALTDSQGSLSGIDVDTAYALADALGIARVELVSVQNASSALTGDCDVVMGVKTGESADVTVLGSYAQSALGLFSAGEVPSVPVPVASLSGATVGVQAGSVSQEAFEQLSTGATEQTFSNLNEAFDALASGTVDYVVCDAYAGAYLACTTGAGTFAGTIDEPVALGVGVSATSEISAEVQSAIEKIQGNGVADIAKSRWVGDFPQLTSASRVLAVTS